MTEVIEGEAVEVVDAPPVKALTTLPSVAHVQSGLGAIALLSDEDFERNLVVLEKGAERARRIQKAILEAGTDYGAEPGIKRPFLHKPGAEKFEKAYGLATSYTVERHVSDGEEAPELEFIVHARVHLGTTDGPVIAEGLGEASAWERKYRYRAGTKACPKCGADSIRKGTKQGTSVPEWYCWAKQGGCGARFEINDPALSGAPDDVENPDPWDLANTLLKMARKRAYVDAILTATGTSGLFTQDEDSPVVRRTTPPPAHTGRPPAEAGDPGPLPVAGPESGPGTWSGTVEKVDPEGSVRRVKVMWHRDGGKVVHDKVEVKAKVKGVGKVTGILLDDLAIAAGEGNLAQGEWVSFDGELTERPWQDQNGKDMPPIKEAHNVKHIWRYRDNAWVELSAKTAPSHRVEDELAAAEDVILEGMLDLPGALPLEPTWQEKVKGMPNVTAPDGKVVQHVGYFLGAGLARTSSGSPVWTASVGVPGVGVFSLVINESDAEAVGIVRDGSAAFEDGQLVVFSGSGWKGRIILAGIGLPAESE